MDVKSLKEKLESEGFKVEIYQDSGPPVRLLARILGEEQGQDYKMADVVVVEMGAKWVSEAQDESSIAGLGYPDRVG